MSSNIKNILKNQEIKKLIINTELGIGFVIYVIIITIHLEKFVIDVINKPKKKIYIKIFLVIRVRMRLRIYNLTLRFKSHKILIQIIHSETNLDNKDNHLQKFTKMILWNQLMMNLQEFLKKIRKFLPKIKKEFFTLIKSTK